MPGFPSRAFFVFTTASYPLPKSHRRMCEKASPRGFTAFCIAVCAVLNRPPTRYPIKGVRYAELLRRPFVDRIDFPNEDTSKSNRRMECMLCAPGVAVELRLEPTNPYDENAVAIFGERGTQLDYVSAERAPLIGKRIKEGEAIAVFQTMHGSGVLTLPDPVSDAPKRPPPRQARPAQRPVYDPHAFYPDKEGPELGA
jgi:hypothetical protein